MSAARMAASWRFIEEWSSVICSPVQVGGPWSWRRSRRRRGGQSLAAQVIPLGKRTMLLGLERRNSKLETPFRRRHLYACPPPRATMAPPAVEVKRLPERERDGYIPHRGGEREGSAEGDASVECSRAINVGGSWLPRLGSNQRLP